MAKGWRRASRCVWRSAPRGGQITRCYATNRTAAGAGSGEFDAIAAPRNADCREPADSGRFRGCANAASARSTRLICTIRSGAMAR